MFETIQSIAATLRNFVNRAEYVLNVVKWGIESAGKISDIFASFPKPPVPVADSKESDKGSGKSDAGNGESNAGNPVPDSSGQLAGGKQNGNGGV